MGPDERLLQAAFRGDRAAIGATIAQGASTDARDERGETALLIAMREKHVGVVRELLCHKPALDCHDERGNQPLHYAANYGQVEAIDALLDAGADIHAKNQFGSTPLHVAADWHQSAAIRRLLERGADRSRTDCEGKPPGAHCSRKDVRDLVRTYLLPATQASGFLGRILSRSPSSSKSSGLS